MAMNISEGGEILHKAITREYLHKRQNCTKQWEDRIKQETPHEDAANTDMNDKNI